MVYLRLLLRPPGGIILRAMFLAMIGPYYFRWCLRPRRAITVPPSGCERGTTCHVYATPLTETRCVMQPVMVT